MSLNAQQLEAVHHFGSPLMIVAGAGSGKTTVITQKIVFYCLEMGIPASSILAITFTNKAAKEMNDRVQRALGFSHQPKIATFHRFCADQLRLYYLEAGFKVVPTICDQSDQLKLMKGLLKSFNLSETRYPAPAILHAIQDVKNRLILPHQIQSDSVGRNWDRETQALYQAYQSRLREQNLVDFNDLILEVVRLFQTQPAILSDVQERYPFVLVDEYQDTNSAQYELIQLLTQKFKNLTVVGDFDQTIYSWRGASHKHMLQFEADYPGAKVILLEQNYRSTQPILEAANHLIEHNTSRRPKKLWTDNPSSSLIDCCEAADERAEAKNIARWLQDRHSEGIPYSDMAILFRTNAQTRAIEEGLINASIPYRIVQGTTFFARAEIKDMVAYLKLLHNPNDSLSFSRVVNVPPRGIGEVSLARLLTHAQTHKLPLRDTASLDLLTPKIGTAVSQFWEMLDNVMHLNNSVMHDKVAHYIQDILQHSGYAAYLKANHEEERLENILELMSIAREEELSLDEFLNKISLRTDWEEQKGQASSEVVLTTIHMAKGLEFHSVVLAGLEEGLLPHYRSKELLPELEEERRLCYVALTRAKQRLLLTRSAHRLIFGEMWSNAPSRFWEELPATVLSRVTEKKSFFNPIAPTSSRTNTTSQQSYALGDFVMHNAWGRGQITRIDGAGEQAILHIQFGFQTKKLLAKYAPLTKG